jgi:hypothetical protein
VQLKELEAAGSQEIQGDICEISGRYRRDIGEI